ncbi:hypothetical protein HWQ91_003121 [Salmonella enterica]|nr:hypothetical protein [Salmonella enterica]
MFNVKRNGASVEITDIPQSIPCSVFKNITDDTGANECPTGSNVKDVSDETRGKRGV